MKELAINPWTNPSRNAIARVTNPLPAPTICPCCLATDITLVDNKEIYGQSYGDWPYAFRCTNCGAHVGLHPYTDIPLGTLADQRTRQARTAAKAVFNRLWDGKGKAARSAAYAWLAGAMKISIAECHFGWFDFAACRRAMAICTERLKHQTKERK